MGLRFATAVQLPAHQVRDLIHAHRTAHRDGGATGRGAARVWYGASLFRGFAVAPERFEPGSVRFADAVHLDIQHDRERAVAWMPGGGLELAADEAGVQVSADLPPIPAADRILEEIRTGKRNGLSVEFHALKETREAGVRVIQEAVLTGVAIVAAPSYKSARIEARAKRRRIWL